MRIVSNDLYAGRGDCLCFIRRKYVEAAGGTLELLVNLPGKGVVDISDIGLGR